MPGVAFHSGIVPGVAGNWSAALVLPLIARSDNLALSLFFLTPYFVFATDVRCICHQCVSYLSPIYQNVCVLFQKLKESCSYRHRRAWTILLGFKFYHSTRNYLMLISQASIMLYWQRRCTKDGKCEQCFVPLFLHCPMLLVACQKALAGIMT